MFQKKVLITGGNGYIGNYITKMLAARRPDVLIVSMNRKPAEQ
jgi:nucleoside-diphosphate-sugar epimerase